MKSRDHIYIDGKNASGQRVSLLNPEKTSSSRGNVYDKRSYSAVSTLQIRPSAIRRQELSSYDSHDRYSVESSGNKRRPSQRDALQLERMYSTGSSSTNSSTSTTSTMRSDLYDRTRLSPTPPTPDFLEDSGYEDPEYCATTSPYPQYPARANSYGSYQYASPMEPTVQQSSLDPALHTRLLDLTVRQRSQDITSPITPAVNTTTLPSFGQAFSDYVLSPHAQPTSFEREAHNASPNSTYYSSPHAPSRTSSEIFPKRPSLRVEIHPSSASSNSQPSPSSSDDSLKHRRPEPRKSHSSASATRGPSERHRYPCPLADEYDCRSYFTTSGHASRHAKKHTGKRDAECPECHRCFTRKDNMEQHRRTHSKEGKAKKKLAAGEIRKRVSVSAVSG